MSKKQKASSLSNGLRGNDKSSNFDYLPKEILAEIMSRLDPESVIRLKTLNKSWHFTIKCLIEDPDFVADHLSRSESFPWIFFLLDPETEKLSPWDPEDYMSSMLIAQLVDDSDDGRIRMVDKRLDLPHRLVGNLLNDIEISHCNGIICLTRGYESFTLYNPVLNELVEFAPKTELVMDEYEVIGMGFGCSGSDLYKIVRVLKPMKAEVFAPNTTDSWREIEISLQEGQFGEMGSYAYCQGKCFWLMSGETKTLLCFDISDEVFFTVLLPNEAELSEEEARFSELDVHNDSVCFFPYPSRESTVMWVLEKTHGSYSWRKGPRIEIEELYRIWSCGKSDELLVTTVDGDMALYNPRTKKYRTFPLAWSRVCCYSVYVKSLVSIEAMNRAL